MLKTYIKCLSHYHPEFLLDNRFFSEIMDTTDEWIREKIGVRERRHMADYKGPFPVFEICRRAVDRLVEETGFDLKTVDMIISCSSTEDLQYPGPANMLDAHYKIGCPAFHLKNGCPTIVFAVETARGLLQTGNYRNILLVCGEPFTTQVDYSDRKSAILFGDASVAMVISSDSGCIEIEDCVLGGQGSMVIHSVAPGAKPPVTVHEARKSDAPDFQPRGLFSQDGKEVFKFVTEAMPREIKEFLKKNRTSMRDIHYFIGHQANLTMLHEVCKSLEIEDSKHLYNIDRFGNTSSAGWATVLSQALQDQTFQFEDRILVSVFGAGLSWGHLLCRRTRAQAQALPNAA